MSHARAKLLELAGTRREATLPDGRVVALAYKPNTRPPARRFALHPAASSPVPASSDLRPFAPPVLDQGQTGSCTGHAMAAAVATSFAASGTPLGFVPSPSEIYRNGRALERVPKLDGSFDQLQDNGAEPALVLAAVNTYGVEPTHAADGASSDADPATINDEPTLYDLERERDVRPVDDVEIEDCKNGRPVADVCADIARALGSRRAVTFGTWVSTSFFNYAPGTVLGSQDLNDPQGGGHAICFLGHRTEADGSLSFRVRNSWSASWGDAGDAWVGPAFVAQITDIEAIEPKEAA